VFVVAEAGANHNRNKDVAFELIDAAVQSGADAAKFQTYSANTLYSRFTPNFAGYEDVFNFIKSIELPREWQKDLKLYCDDNGIEFMSTPFDERAVDELYDLGVERFKIAGFEATDPRFVQYVSATKLPLIITVGIGCDLEMTQTIMDWVYSVNASAELTLLHGNHSYPTPYEDINLGQISNFRQQFDSFVRRRGLKIGLSDHTEGILVPPLAVMLGAEVIEKHYTLDRNMIGPDHFFAIVPTELDEMVTNIRIAETCNAVRDCKFTKSEQKYLKAMRSVVAKTPLNKGDVFSTENITTKRPYLENSIAAIDFFNLLGKRINVNLGSDKIVEKEMIDEWKER
tara:strand:+ start:9134 stop:10159 length:1026 start_codon:yes stop_codon:yes gene_type:complete